MMKPGLSEDIQWAPASWFPIRFGFCPSREAWDEFMDLKRLEYRMPYPGGGGACSQIHAPDGTYVLVTLDDETSRAAPYDHLGCLIHESVHVWQALCDQIGEVSPSQEFEAYSIQQISAALIKGYRKSRGCNPWKE